MKRISADVLELIQPTTNEHAELVSRVWNLERHIKNMEAQLEKYKTQAREQFRPSLADMAEGKTGKTVEVEGDGKTLKVTYARRVKSIDADQEATLRANMGDAVDQLFEESQDVKVKSGKAEDLMRLIAKAGENVNSYFTIERKIKPVDNFHKVSAALLPTVQNKESFVKQYWELHAEASVGFKEGK